MVHIAQRIDDGYRGPVSERIYRLLREGTRYDCIRPAVKIAGHVPERLPISDRANRDDCITAQLLNREFECQAGAQRRLFKKQADITSGERIGIACGRTL